MEEHGKIEGGKSPFLNRKEIPDFYHHLTATIPVKLYH